MESSGRLVSQGGRWGWLAVALCVALLAAIVLGLQSHPPAGDAAPATASVPASVPTGREVAVAWISGGGVAATVRVSDRPGHTTFEVEGTGGVPARSYALELGTCPAVDSEAGVVSTAGLGGQFSASVDLPHVAGDETIWMRLLGGNGTDAGAVQGRLADNAFIAVSAGEQPCATGAADVTAGDLPVQFATRRATLSPPTSIGVDLLSASDVIDVVHALGPAPPEVTLGRYDDSESGLTVDPAWIVVDRGVVTSDVGPDGAAIAFHSSNVVRVVNAITGRVAFTFSAPLGPVSCPLAEGASPDRCAR